MRSVARSMTLALQEQKYRDLERLVDEVGTSRVLIAIRESRGDEGIVSIQSQVTRQEWARWVA
jgi:hypothetical protein